MSAFDEQIGGSHYKDMKRQPMELALTLKYSGLQYLLIRYLLRNKAENDGDKFLHTCDLGIEGITTGCSLDQFISDNELDASQEKIMRYIDMLPNIGADQPEILRRIKDIYTATPPELSPAVKARMALECPDCE